MQYIAFLRAINVGGSKVIKMEALRQMLDIPGIKNVRTYIQSGNVLFTATEKDSAKMQAKLEKHLHKQLGYVVEVLLRTVDEVAGIVKNTPYKDVPEGTTLYVALLQSIPTPEAVDALQAVAKEVDSFTVQGTELYATVVKNGAKSSFEPKIVERKLNTLCTIRNWNTMNKVLEMAKPGFEKMG